MMPGSLPMSPNSMPPSNKPLQCVLYLCRVWCLEVSQCLPTPCLLPTNPYNVSCISAGYDAWKSPNVSQLHASFQQTPTMCLVSLQGMMPGSLPMSPNSMPPSNKPLQCVLYLCRVWCLEVSQCLPTPCLLPTNPYNVSCISAGYDAWKSPNVSQLHASFQQTLQCVLYLCRVWCLEVSQCRPTRCLLPTNPTICIVYSAGYDAWKSPNVSQLAASFQQTLQYVLYTLQGMMPGTLPMSPNSMPPSNKPGSPYYPFTSKRPSDDSLRGWCASIYPATIHSSYIFLSLINDRRTGLETNELGELNSVRASGSSDLTSPVGEWEFYGDASIISWSPA